MPNHHPAIGRLERLEQDRRAIQSLLVLRLGGRQRPHPPYAAAVRLFPEASRRWQQVIGALAGNPLRAKKAQRILAGAHDRQAAGPGQAARRQLAVGRALHLAAAGGDDPMVEPARA